MFLIFAAVAFLLFLMAVSQSSLEQVTNTSMKYRTYELARLSNIYCDNQRVFFCFIHLISQNRRMVWWLLATLRRNGADCVTFCFPALHLWTRLEQRTVGHCVMI